MNKIGIVVKRNKPEGVELARKIVEWAGGKGIEPFLEEDVAEQLSVKRGYPKSEIPRRVDLIVVLGGDGTLLSVARLAAEKSVPILGVNLGSLGFLTEITVEELFPTLEKILAGDYEVEMRMMLNASIYRHDELLTRYLALNDVVVSKSSMARIIDLEATIDDNYLTLYRVDGLIISTPTGSTGYSLAAAGPIVYPTLHAMILTPICPFTLNNRPILIPDKSRVGITLKTENVDHLLTIDGQVAFALKAGDVVVVEKAKSCTKLIKSPYRDYYEVLRAKLKWSGTR